MPKRNPRLMSCPALFFTLFGLSLPLGSGAQDLLVNGSFETGTFAGWTRADQLNPADSANADHFYLSTPGANTPAVNGLTFKTAANAAGGNFYAVTASDLPGAHALLQSFTVPSGGGSLKLSFQMFVNDQSGIGPTVDPSGLDYTTGGSRVTRDNQHARVDILRAGALNLSTSPADIVTSIYIGTDPSGFDASFNIVPNAFTLYQADLTNVLASGQSYRIRFAEVDNVSALNQGVDNVHLLSTTPEPGSLGLLTGLSVSGGLFLLRRNRRAARI